MPKTRGTANSRNRESRIARLMNKVELLQYIVS